MHGSEWKNKLHMIELLGVTADSIDSLDQSSKLHLLQTLTIEITFINPFSKSQ